MKAKRAGHKFRLAFLMIAAMMLATVFSACDSARELDREAEDFDNIKQAYSEIVTRFMDQGDASIAISVQSQQKTAGWQGEAPVLYYLGGGPGYPIPACTDAGQTYFVEITVDDNGTPTPNITVR